MVFKKAEKSDEGRSATPSTDRKKRRLSTEPALPVSVEEQRQRARLWAEKLNTVSTAPAPVITASSSSSAAPSRSEPSTAEKRPRGRPPKSSYLDGNSPIPVFAEPEEREPRPVRKTKKPLQSDGEDAPIIVVKRRQSKKFDSASTASEPSTPKREQSPRKANTPSSKIQSPAGSSFLPTSEVSNNNTAASATAETQEVSDSSCRSLCEECSGNFHVVVGIVLLSWFIALFVDGTVGASCLIVAVIVSSLRRFVDFLCDSCASKSEKCYYSTSANRHKSD